MPENYHSFIQNIKHTISKARHKAILAANAEMVLLYWEIGRAILEQQNNFGWGAKVIDRMSYDLQNEFEGLSGFSSRNLKYMRKFAAAYDDYEIVQRTVALIPWRTNIALLDKLNDYNSRIWYAQKVISQGYSRDVLVFQIESGLHLREGAALNNFPASAPHLLVKSKNKLIVEYALTGYTNPISIANWEAHLSDSLYEHLKSSLPTIEEIEQEMSDKKL